MTSAKEAVTPEEPTGSIYDMFESDDNLEKKGIWVDYSGAGSFLVARAGGANQKFAKVLQAKTQPYKFQIDNDLMDEKVGRKLLIEAFVEAVLLDWKDVYDRSGVKMSCTKDNAVKLFTDLPDLFQDLQQQASKFANFRRQEIERTSGN